MLRMGIALILLCIFTLPARAQMPTALWKLELSRDYWFGEHNIPLEGNRMVVGNGKEAMVIDVNTGKKINTLNITVTDGGLSRFAISPNGNFFAFSSFDLQFGELDAAGKVAKWYNFKQLSTYRKEYDLGALNFRVLNDGTVVTVARVNDQTYVLQANKSKITVLKYDLDKNGRSENILISSDGQWIAYNTQTGNPDLCVIRSLFGKNEQTYQLAGAGKARSFSADGKYLATATATGNIQVIELSSGRMISSRQFCNRKTNNGDAIFCWPPSSADFQPSKNNVLLLEQDVIEAVGNHYQRAYHRGNLVLFDFANNKPYQLPIDTVNLVSKFVFANNGSIIIAEESDGANKVIKAWRTEDLLRLANEQFDEPPKITTKVPATGLVSATTAYEVNACIQQLSKNNKLNLAIKVNGDQVFFVENSNKISSESCSYELKQKIELSPGIFNKVDIIATNDKGQATYAQEVKCTVPRKLPLKDESVTYAAMNIALIHDNDLFSAQTYKRFLEREGSMVTVIDMEQAVNYDFSPFDLLLAWRDNYNNLPEPNAPNPTPYSRVRNEDYKAFLNKLKSSGKPLICIGRALELFYFLDDINNKWAVFSDSKLQLLSENNLTTKYHRDKSMIFCEKRMYHWALMPESMNSSAITYVPYSAGINDNGKIVHPVVRFKSKYGLFGLAAPFELWTPEAKDFLLAFLSSFCPDCPRAATQTAKAVSITWEQPNTTPVNTANATYSIKACISEPKTAINEVAVLLNGTRVNIPERGIKAVKPGSGCSNQFEYTLTLSPGENRIQINLTTATGTISSETRTIYYQKAETVQSNTQNASAGKRLALIIGNSAYLNGGALRNPVNDATDIAATLRNMGFEVLLHTDLALRQMDKALEEFGKKLKNYQVGLFYYAGHGVQVGGENYLVPIDAKLATEGETRYECVPSGILLAKMEEAATTNIIILDACRNNPFARSWSRSTGGTGLAAINAPKGTFIGFATSPGNTAADGSGRNGVFTNAFLQNIKTPGITIDQLFNRINRTVDGLTNGAQIPWKSSSLQDDFYFNR